MRVLIDTTFLRRGPSGTAVYIERLIPELRAQGVEIFEVANSKRGLPGGGPLRSLLNLGADLVWRRGPLGRRARELAVDVLHHPLPAHAGGTGVAQVVTVHDLAFAQAPELFARRWRHLAAAAHPRDTRAADAVIAVSHATAGEIERRWGVPADRIVVAAHGPGQWRRTQTRAEPVHFLYVGDAEPRKRVDLLLSAYRHYRAAASEPLDLVLAGASAALAGGAGVGGEPSPDLAALHARAAALVHLATLEGFGLTVLEAMAWGTPVIATPSPGVVEVCGDAALYVRDDEVADAMQRLAGDPRLQADLGARGVERARAFSWEQSARAHIEAYTLAIRARGVVSR